MATETKKSRKKEEGGNNFLTGIRTYFTEVRQELNKVSWPTRDDVRHLTIVVLIVTIASAIALGLLSFILSLLVNDYGMQYPIILGVMFLIIIAGTVWSFNRDASSKGGY